METVYKIGLISDLTTKDGKFYQELHAVADDGKMITVLVQTSNPCDHLANEYYSSECDECEYKDTCELTEASEILVGGILVIVDNNEYGRIKPINEIGKRESISD